MACVEKQLELEPVMNERYEDPRGAHDAEDWTTGPNPCYFDPSTTSSVTTVSRTSPHHRTSKTLSLLYRIPAHLRTHLWSKLPPTNANENGNGLLPVPGGPQNRIGNGPHMRGAFDSPRSPPNNKSQLYLEAHSIGWGTVLIYAEPSTVPRSPSNNKSTAHVPCKFYKQGACQSGKACPFLHSDGIGMAANHDARP